jgi:anti-repressor protein
LNELINKPNQTPIEIALGIDENGMTTVKKLYEFLELNPTNYARWIKSNIIENQFAEENIDFHSSPMTSEGKGNFAENYKLTAKFAKKLSMTAKNERGEQARNYFTETEEKLKEVVLNMDGLSTEMQALLMHDKKIKSVIEHIQKTDTRVGKLENNMVIDYGQQRVLERKVNETVLRHLGGKGSNAYKEISKVVFSECNRDIKDFFNVNSRNNIPNLKFDAAITYIANWEPCNNTKLKIQDTNNQVKISDIA